LIPPIGIDGIVLGTVIARFSGGALMLAVLAKGLGGLKLDRRELALRGDTVRRILRIGIPAALDGSITWGGHLLFLVIIANLASGSLKNTIFAAHMIGIRVEAITYLPAVAWGYAAATMVGQSLGAGDPARAVRAGHEAALQCSLLGALITAIFFFGAGDIYELMHDEALVGAAGVPAFRLLAFFQIPLVLSIVYVFALRGAGDTRFAMGVSVFGVLCLRLPLAWYFGIVRDGGLFGAWIGMCADMAFRAAAILAWYVRGRWMHVRI
jgi:Na+-driven multidrug efflux pump